MIKCALLLLSCLTIFAQRTPLSVNGTIVNNPNLTNTSSTAWTVSGASVNSHDRIWTNSSVASGSIQPVGGSNVYMPGTLSVVGQMTNDALQASALVYATSTKSLGSITPGADGTVLTAHGPGVAPSYDPIPDGATIWTNDNGTITATSTIAPGGVAFEFKSGTNTLAELYDNSDFNGAWWELENFDQTVSVLMYSHEAYGYVDMTYNDGVNVSEVFLRADQAGPQFYLYMGPSFDEMVKMEPGVGVGITPYRWQTPVAHTSGNLFEFGNVDTNKMWGTFDGEVNAAAGFSSTATDSAVTIASTGWTNTFGKNAVVYMDGVGLTYTVYNNALTPVYTNSVTVVNATVILQPSGKVIITAGTLGVGRATPF